MRTCLCHAPESDLVSSDGWHPNIAIHCHQRLWKLIFYNFPNYWIFGYHIFWQTQIDEVSSVQPASIWGSGLFVRWNDLPTTMCAPGFPKPLNIPLLIGHCQELYYLVSGNSCNPYVMETYQPTSIIRWDSDSFYGSFHLIHCHYE